MRFCCRNFWSRGIRRCLVRIVGSHRRPHTPLFGGARHYVFHLVWGWGWGGGGRLQTACGQRRVDSKNSPPQQPAQPPIRQLLGAADAQTAQDIPVVSVKVEVLFCHLGLGTVVCHC